MTTNLITRDRAPDYHIGANGIPRLTQVITAGSRMRKMNSHHHQLLQPTDPVKLNKCLYNLTVRNGSTVQSDKPANSSKIESDIAIRNTQYSSGGGGGGVGSKSSSSLSPALNGSLRSSSPTTVTSSPLRTSGDPRRSGINTSHQFNSSSIPRSNNNNISSYSSNRNNTGGGGGSPRTLLGSRQRHQQQQHQNAVTTGDDDGHEADANLINAGGDRRRSSSAVVRQYNRLSAAIDNRLSYQRKYDRTIFGCNRLDQFVLPPLQI